MRLEDCYYLGTITRTHGLKGHLIVKLDTDEPELYNNMESVLLEFNGVPVPFFLEECLLYNRDFLKIKFEDASIKIEEILGTDIYLPLSSLPKLEGKQFYFHEVIGFDLIDKNGEKVGTISEINDNGPQPLFSILTSQDKTIYIPIINDWIIEVNRENSFISMKLPQGILNL